MRTREKLSCVVRWLKEYKKQTGCQGVVLGISGGKDSTVVAMLAKKVWGNNVFGVLMPNGKQADIQDSMAIVDKLGLEYMIVNIKDAYNGLLKNITLEHHISEKALTNIPPRLRMTTLYAIAQTRGWQVIGTGNATETYLGWFTKWGDGACDLNPIGKLTCTEVIKIGKVLAKEFGLDEKYIDKTPADGLTGKSDEDNFGFTYETAERVMDGDTSGIDPILVEKIKKMNNTTEHKRKAIPKAGVGFYDQFIKPTF